MWAAAPPCIRTWCRSPGSSPSPGAGSIEMTASTRVRFAPVEGAAQLFTADFCDYLCKMHDDFTPRVHALRRQRDAVLRRALEQGTQPGPQPASAATAGDWKVPPVPEDLRRPGIEISGPCSITSMFINALTPGPEGERAEGDLDDDEDSAGHRLVDTVRAAHNRLAAVNGELAFSDPARGREYRIAPGELPFFMHRERALHLDEPEVSVDGRPVPAAIVGTTLTLFYAGRAQAGRGQGIYFYLPKVESAEEVAWYRDFFDASRRHLPALTDAVIRGIPLVESLPAVYLMEEMLYALGPYAAGLNGRRWGLNISHRKTAGDPFKKAAASGRPPTQAMADPVNYPVKIEVPAGPVTVGGTRRNARMVIEYVEGWLGGRGAKGIDSLAGKPGVHPALMEDLATGRMSVAQIAQRIRHHVKDSTDPSQVHDFPMVKRLLHEEVEDILRLMPKKDVETEARYGKAVKVAMRWIKNYTDLDFRSLGSYTHADLERIAAAPDAF